MTLGELHLLFRDRLIQPGYAEAFSELLDYHLHLPAHAVWTRPTSTLPELPCQALIADMKRFDQGMPLAHLTGRAHFYGLEFVVTPQVLIPRPDSECLLTSVLSRLPETGSALDIGCGSGCLSVCLAVNKSRALLTATDSSFSALRLARLNACRHGVARHIRWHHCDLFPAHSHCPSQGFDIIFSNPPYISAEEWPDLDPSVRDHEPAAALLGGVDGLAYFRRIIAESGHYLRPGGHLLFEVGYKQAESVAGLMSASAFRNIERRKDLAGIERVVSAQFEF